MAWQPPSPGMLSLNTDASVINNGVYIGVGVVVRNHLGDLVLAGGERVQGRFWPSVAELLAICKGLEYVVEHNWLLEKVECDCLEAVRVVNDVANKLVMVGEFLSGAALRAAFGLLFDVVKEAIDK
ncbi:PREDICTED: uncharacterized protein LOC101307802 [Fragaria vesca subsp. vesca]